MTREKVIEKWNSLKSWERNSWIAQVLKLECDNCGEIGNCMCRGLEIGSGVPYFNNYEDLGVLLNLIEKDGWDSVTMNKLFCGTYRVTISCCRGPCQLHGSKIENVHGAFEIEAEHLPDAVALAFLIAKLENVNE